MNDQPEALRIAYVIEGGWDREHGRKAAAELRRLHNLCAEWEKKAATWLASPEAAKLLDGYRELFQRVDTLEYALRQAVEALEMVVVDAKTTPNAYEAARQAITAVKQALGEMK